MIFLFLVGRGSGPSFSGSYQNSSYYRLSTKTDYSKGSEGWGAGVWVLALPQLRDDGRHLG